MAPLDGLRGFASLYVIVAHLFPLWRGRGIGERVGRTLLDLGWSGVDLFFVKVGDLAEHGVEGTSLFADADHLADHVRKDVGRL